MLALVSIVLFSNSGLSQSSIEDGLLAAYEEERYQAVIDMADSIIASGSEFRLSRIYQIKADAYYFLNDVPKSLQHYLLAIEVSDQFPLNTTNELECYSHAGFCYKYLGKYQEAIPYYERALAISLQLGDSVEIANQSSNLGGLQSQLGNYKAALEYLNTAYQIDIQLMDTVALAYDQVNLGELKLKIGDINSAIRYFKEGLSVKESIENDHTTHLLRLGKLGYAYLMAAKLDSALHYNDLAISEAKRLEDSLSLAKQWIVRAEIFNAKREYEVSKKWAQKSFEYFSEGESGFRVTSAIQLADGLAGTGKNSEAKQLLYEVLSIAVDINLLEEQGMIYDRLYRLHDPLGETNAAFDNLKKYVAIKEVLQRAEKQKAVLVLEQEYQSNLKQQQIELLQAKNDLTAFQLEKRRRENWVLIGLLVFICAAAVYVYLTVRKKNQLKNSLLTAEINELRTQIMSFIEGSSESMTIEREALNSAAIEPLSDREFEILNFVLTDLSNTEIADKAFVSVNTVKFHLKNIYSKLGVANRKEALKYAIQASSN